MAGQRSRRQGRLRRAVDEHGDALAVILLVMATLACIVGLLWLAGGAVDGVIMNASRGV